MVSSAKQNRWAQLLAEGGAEVFFGSYPDDAELAKVINGFPDSVQVTAEQIRRDRQRFHQRPLRGEVVDEQEASPTKNVIRNKASQLVAKEAFVEILDNIFDNFERNTPEKLHVQIVVYPETDAAPGEIVIRENSGGIERQRSVPLVQLGLSERSAKGIGAWGEGFKMAVFALGEEVEVFSAYPQQEPIAIHFPRGWLDPGSVLWKKWRVSTYKVARNAPPAGSTVIRINHLHSQVLASLGLSNKDQAGNPETTCRELARFFGEVYAEKYHNLRLVGFDVSIEITIDYASQVVRFADPVRTRLARNLAFLPWLRPIHWTAEWETKIEDPGEEGRFRTARLRAEVFAGLAATFEDFQSYLPHPPGVEMWGNGRLFSLKGRVSDSSVGWGFKYSGRGGTNPAATASSRRLVIVVLFTSDDSRDIPWAAPVKNDYNRRSDFYAEIQELLARVIKLFKNALAFHAGRLLPFSHAWSQFNEEQKLDTLFSDSDATSEFQQGFAHSRFGEKLLAFGPDFSFRDIDGKDAEPTVWKLFGISTAAIGNIVRAASETKDSAEQVVEFLKALFPGLAKQAELEEAFGLAEDEELEL